MPDTTTFLKKTKVLLDDICSEIAEGGMNFEYTESVSVPSVRVEYIDENNAKVYINPMFAERERDVILMLGAARVWQMRHNFPLLKVKMEYSENIDVKKLCDILNEYVHHNHARYIVRSNHMLLTNAYMKNDVKIMEDNVENTIARLSQGEKLSYIDIAICIACLCYIYDIYDETKADSYVKNMYVAKNDIAEKYERAVEIMNYHDCSYRFGCIRFFESILFMLGLEDMFEIGFYKGYKNPPPEFDL